MCNSTGYTKNKEQVAIEHLAKKIANSNFMISTLKELSNFLSEYERIHQNWKNASVVNRHHLEYDMKLIQERVCIRYGCLWDDAIEYDKLFKEFDRTLASCIVAIANEVKTHASINRLAQTYGARYDSENKEYDTYFEVIANTYGGLYSVISKRENKGKLRLDTYLDKPEEFYIRLRCYMQRNIIIDTARVYSAKMKHEETELIETKDGNEQYKDGLDPKREWENSTVDAALGKYDSSLRVDLITAILDRFSARKAVAAYLYSQVLLCKYDKKQVIENLTNEDFSVLFQNTLLSLEDEYDVDLSDYLGKKTNAERFLSSFRKAPLKTKQDRIDRLLSDAKKEVKLLSACRNVQETYHIKRGHYFIV